MSTVEQVLNEARSQIGTAESPPKSNRTKYGAWYGMDGQAWCGMFVSWVFNSAGMSLTSAPHYAYCPYGVDWFKAQGRWQTGNPQPGDVVFYRFNGGVADHTGIVEQVLSPTEISAIEGNTALANDTNGGSVMRRQRNTSLVLGYGRPNYSTASPQPVNAAVVQDEEDEDMPKPDDIVSEYRWPNGDVARLLRDGSVRCYGAPFCGSVNDVPAAQKLSWSEGPGVLRPADPMSSAQGYRVYDWDANFVGDFTPTWWAANKPK